jgi:hypothetical protein
LPTIANLVIDQVIRDRVSPSEAAAYIRATDLSWTLWALRELAEAFVLKGHNSLRPAWQAVVVAASRSWASKLPWKEAESAKAARICRKAPVGGGELLITPTIAVGRVYSRTSSVTVLRCRKGRPGRF